MTRLNGERELHGIDGVIQHLQSHEQANVALLLGPAGSGKTTLLSVFCVTLCDRLLQRFESVHGLDETADRPPIPIWLPCPEIDDNSSSLDSVFRVKELALSADQPAIVLADGLDEIPYDRQQDTMALLDKLLLDLEARPRTLALVTCRSEEIVRISGIDNLLQLFPSYEISPIDVHKRKQLFALLTEQLVENNRVRLRETPTEAVARLESLLQRSSHLGSFETPLLLTLFVIVALQDDAEILDLSLQNLYQRAIEVLVRRRLTWPQLHVARDVLRYLAGELHRRGSLGQNSTDAVSRESDVVQLLKLYVSTSGKVADSAPIELLSLLLKSGVVAGDYGQISFVHRSFFEHFLADRIAEEISQEIYTNLSHWPLSDMVSRFLYDYRIVAELRKALSSTKHQSFDTVRFRGGNAVNLLKKSGILLRDLDLRDTVLAGADFREANLDDVDFGAADLQRTDFSFSSLRRADWSRVSAVGHLQIEEGREIRSVVYSRRRDTVFLGNTLGELIELRADSLEPVTQRAHAHDHTVTILALDDVNDWLASAGYDEHCHIWSMEDLTLLGSVPQLLPKCRALSCYTPGPDVGYLVCGTPADTLLLYKLLSSGDDPTRRRVHVQLIQELPGISGSAYRSISWSPDGRLLLVAGFEGALHWCRFDNASRRLSRISGPRFQAPSTATFWGACFSEDGSHAAAIDSAGSLHLWYIATREPVLILTRSLVEDGIGLGRCVCLNQDGTGVYCGDDNGTILALSRNNGSIKLRWRRKVHEDSVYTVRLIRSSRNLLTCGLDAQVCLLDAASGEDSAQPFSNAQPTRRLSILGLRVRADLLEECDQEYLKRRGAKLVKNRPAPEDKRIVQYDYDLAISFAGEDRRHAEALASRLEKLGMRTFYDKDEAAKLWGKNLSMHLYEIYAKKSLFCAILISRFYVDNDWTYLELEAALERDRKQRGQDYILPIRLDETEVVGLSADRGYQTIDVGIDRIAEIFREKFMRRKDDRLRTEKRKKKTDAGKESNDAGG